ncbi:Clavaminate synthase-like protein [Ramaria rubella]|nr:Clavaminate synthase-like protein [Ramaria rubella]
MYLQQSGIKKGSKIVILDSVPSYSQFLRDHLQSNTPCLISPSLIASWPALPLWTRNLHGDLSAQTLDPQPNWDYICENYGDELVSVAHCASRIFSDQERGERPLREVIGLWQSGGGEGLYVKDWHLAKSTRAKGDPQFYETPEIFQDDWMNAFWEEEGKDDFRFVYMGVTGTFTPLHRDVYTSYSWSTNITGTKIWRLFPPSVAHHLRRFPFRTSSEIVYDVRNVDSSVFHEFELAQKDMLVVEQPPGWTIFVPSGWYHQVENVTDAISINHNWCNINNLSSMYASLLTAVSDVESALSDVHDLLRTRSGKPEWQREWTDVVQDVLKKDSGWDWVTFWRMVQMNVGQQRDPPLIPNPVWPLTPKTLRPSITETRIIVRRLLDDFVTTRASDITNIPELSMVLDELDFLLSA